MVLLRDSWLCLKAIPPDINELPNSSPDFISITLCDYNPFTSDFVFSTQAELVYKPVNLDISYALSEQRAQHVSGEPVVISDEFDLDALPRNARIHVDYEIDDGIQMIGINRVDQNTV